jgi:hypothetical protein
LTGAALGFCFVFWDFLLGLMVEINAKGNESQKSISNSPPPTVNSQPPIVNRQ